MADKKAKPVKPEITIQGKKYELRFDLWALEQIEEEFGGVTAMLKGLRGAEGTSLCKTMSTVFRILANSARVNAGLAANVTGDEVKHVLVGPLTRAVNAAIDAGMKAETAYGNEADDEVYDGYADEYDEKNV